MSNFHKKNRTFRTLDLFGLIVLVGVVFTVCGVILAEAMQDDRPARARLDSESLATQILAEQNKSISSSVLDRSPASAESSANLLPASGLIGHDPWGKPYHYLVRRSAAPVSGRSLVRVFVWSEGPNGNSDTDISHFEAFPTKAKLKLRGDDLGYSVESIVE